MGRGGDANASKAREDFFWSDEEEPHAQRRKAILKAHPEISKLQGPEWRTKYITCALTAAQVYLSRATMQLSWPAYLAVAYVFGATITQALFLAVHEISHNLAFKTSSYNRVLGFIANFPIVFPFSIAFRGYHIEHHKFQGVDGVDTDIPSRAEGRVVRGTLMKIIWASCQILTYALRPCLLRFQEFTPTHVANLIMQVLFDLTIYHFWGWRPLAYMILCILLAGGLHPCAGHFISEHYVFPHLSDTQETYSYYGILNKLTWNVGYHNEHHDFPYVAWTRLPALRAAAPEFYDSLEQCDSWCRVIYDYCFREEVGPFNRVKRKTETTSAGGYEFPEPANFKKGGKKD